MKITSPEFEQEQKIPMTYTCDGDDKSPPLKIEDVPENAKSLALINDDPDAPGGMWVHWVVWNISPTTTEIAEGQNMEGLAVEGTTDFRRTGYGGPCPPSGNHRYYFKLYALDTTLDLPDSTTKKQLEAAMEGHIIEQAELMGKYNRG